MKYLLLICFFIPLLSFAQGLVNIDSLKYHKAFNNSPKNVGMRSGTTKNIEIRKKIYPNLLNKEVTKAIIAIAAKDAQIQALSKTVEDNKRKVRAFILLITLMACSIFSLLYSQSFTIKEKKNEVGKRINAELELESKQKELAAKILQLVQKNVVLETIEAEIASLKSSGNNSAGKTFSRIKSLIEHNMADENQWEQFSTEFSSLHQEYINALVINFGEFSKSEIRLISLLKMNLSSKEIANTLHISDEGVKKARYRLRKKLNLGPEDDLQGFLLSFS